MTAQPKKQPLAGPRLKIERAEQHILDFKKTFEAWGETEPYLVVKEVEPDTGDHVFIFRRKSDFPPVLSAILGDAVHNLRAALDYLVNALVTPAGERPSTSAAFPICNSAEVFKAKLPQVETVGQETHDLLKATKAYRGGNDALWGLRELDNIDKHRFLITFAAAHQAIGLNFGSMLQRGLAAAGKDWESIDMPPILLQPGSGSFPLEDGDELFRVAAKMVAEHNPDPPEFHIDVALGEPEVFEGESLLPTIVQLGDLVAGIVESFAPLFD